MRYGTLESSSSLSDGNGKLLEKDVVHTTDFKAFFVRILHECEASTGVAVFNALLNSLDPTVLVDMKSVLS